MTIMKHHNVITDCEVIELSMIMQDFIAHIIN